MGGLKEIKGKKKEGRMEERERKRGRKEFKNHVVA